MTDLKAKTKAQASRIAALERREIDLSRRLAELQEDSKLLAEHGKKADVLKKRLSVVKNLVKSESAARSSTATLHERVRRLTEQLKEETETGREVQDALQAASQREWKLHERIRLLETENHRLQQLLDDCRGQLSAHRVAERIRVLASMVQDDAQADKDSPTTLRKNVAVLRTEVRNYKEEVQELEVLLELAKERCAAADAAVREARFDAADVLQSFKSLTDRLKFAERAHAADTELIRVLEQEKHMLVEEIERWRRCCVNTDAFGCRDF